MSPGISEAGCQVGAARGAGRRDSGRCVDGPVLSVQRVSGIADELDESLILTDGASEGTPLVGLLPGHGGDFFLFVQSGV